jgi:rhodanese-related sulfurtransferase
VANLLRADFGINNIWLLEGGIESWKLTVDPTVEVI